MKPKTVGHNKISESFNYKEIGHVVDWTLQPIYICEMTNKMMDNASAEFIIELMNTFRGHISQHVKRIFSTISNVRIRNQNCEQSTNKKIAKIINENFNLLSLKYNEVANLYKFTSDLLVNRKIKKKSNYMTGRPQSRQMALSFVDIERYLDELNLLIIDCFILQNDSRNKIADTFETLHQYHSESISSLENAIASIHTSVNILSQGSEYEMAIPECCKILDSETSPVLDECLSHLTRNHCESYLVPFKLFYNDFINLEFREFSERMENLKNSYFHFMNTETVYDVSAVLKNYLIHLPVKLLENTDTLIWKDIPELEKSHQMLTIKNCLAKLNPYNVTALKQILILLKKVSLNCSVNKMCCDNLATVFCPVLFPVGYSMTDLILIKNLKIVISIMIDEVCFFFPDIEPPVLDDTLEDVINVESSLQNSHSFSYSSNSYPEINDESSLDRRYSHY